MRPVGAVTKFLGFAVAAAAFLGTLGSTQAAPAENKAVVRGVRGTANYSADRGANWKKLAVGQKLGQDSVVRTAPGSQVDLFLGDNGPFVRITEDTTLGLDKLTVDEIPGTSEKIIETQLDLRNGRILGNVQKMAAASKYEVKTPQGVAGIRGTKYDISADGSVSVLEGQVIVVYIVNGVASTATVNAGQTARPPAVGGAPVPVNNIPEGILEETGPQIPTENNVEGGEVEVPVVVIVTEPIKEAIQEGDKANLETEI